MDEIDWEALLDQMPTIVVLGEDEARNLSMQVHPSSQRPAFLSAALN
ncbi:MAG: hypothetical protein K0R44_12 [Thermomicrobiales bacterium]|jgi:hypothetical protein|nr:hypothetical protein [Thermomicrobiales bacterium]MDF3014787.1 hypothetical protein [Thermomicrobiales bacterium]